MNAFSSASTDIKVSVAMITYNHEQFIAQAIESVLMQQTDFTFELVIGEDCSTDRTRSIVAEYAQKFPDRLRPIFHEHNIGAYANLIAVLKACQGQYLALIEGDDFWTSPNKLQVQADALDRNPDWSICAHLVNVFVDDNTQPQYHIPRFAVKPVSTLDDLARAPFVFTSATVYRRIPVERYPDWINQVNLIDHAVSLFYAQYGKIGFINEVMSSYRVHSGGVWSQRGNLARRAALAHDLRFMARHMQWRYCRSLESVAARSLLQNLKTYLAEDSLPEARAVAAEIFSMSYCFPDLPWNKFIKRSLMAYFPRFFPNQFRKN